MTKETLNKIIKILTWLLRITEYLKKTNYGALDEKQDDDPRNVPVSAIVKSSKLPSEYINPDVFKTEAYNQKRLGICVATAQTSQMELLYPDKDFSVRFSYRMAKYIDYLKYKRNFEGTWGHTMARVHKDYGVATTKTRPENFDLPHWLYIKFNFTKQEIAEAKKYKIKGYVWAYTDDEIKLAIKKYGSVSTTIQAKSMWNNAKGNHRILLVGWNKRGFIFQNSWDEVKRGDKERKEQELLELPYSVKKWNSIAYIKSDADKKKIDNHIKKVEKKYKYFSAYEAKNINPKTMEMLDKARGFAGIPFVITSGCRTIQKNKQVGGKIDSCHLEKNKCSAVDIRVRNSQERWKIVNAGIKAGFTRIGIAETFVHFDSCKDTRHPDKVIWTY